VFAKRTFTLTFTTPAFIGGADRTKAEFRIPSFVGILRYWFRNLALTATDDLNAVYGLETKLFGNTDGAGLVRVCVEKENIKVKNSLKGLDQNLGYLGYGNFVGTRTVREFIEPDSQVKLTFLYPKKYEKLKLLESLLFLVSHLGALGSRNRRGWGAFYLKPEGGSGYESWEVWNFEELERAYNEFASFFSPSGASLQEIRVYELPYKHSDALGILKKIGKNYKEFRQYLPPDYLNLKRLLLRQFKHPKVVYNRSWLGLPIIARYRSVNNVSAEVRLFRTDEEKPSRLASPLIFRPVKTKNERSSIALLIYRPQVLGREGRFYRWGIPNSRVEVRHRSVTKPVVANKPFVEFVENELLINHLGAKLLGSFGRVGGGS